MNQEARAASDRSVRTVIFEGKSGERFRFQVSAISATFKAVGGVYIVTKRSFEDATFTTKATHQPLVIGHTANLADALVSASQLAKLIAQGANCICVCAAADAEHRAHIEKDLIEGNEDFRGRLRSLHYLSDPPVPPARRPVDS